MTVLLFPNASRFQKAFLLVCGLSLTASTLLGQSRGGVLALGWCLVYLLARTRRKTLFLGIALLAIVGSILILPRTGLDRLQEDEAWGNQLSTHSRIELLKAGVHMVAANPVVGVGLGMFKPMSPVYNPGVERPQMGHNTYLEIAAELGIPAALLFMSILFWSWRRARRLGKALAEQGDAAASQMALAVETGLASFALGAVFLSAEYVKHLWILVFFGLALARVLMLQQQAVAPEPPPLVEKGQGHRAQRNAERASLRYSVGHYR
jgi:O-antigen ligase